jgi:hypothetical protein
MLEDKIEKEKLKTKKKKRILIFFNFEDQIIKGLVISL